MTDAQWWQEVFQLVGHLAISFIGLAVLAMAWKAPEHGSMPLVLTEMDKKRDDGTRNIRQVLLSVFGVVLIIIGVDGLT